ncbi:MAG TPA: alpha/beta family hydrolase, partial [Pseudomonadales bacterium]|nr:alpha/beta family hydrolase [Pseudomonadales bacterium]
MTRRARSEAAFLDVPEGDVRVSVRLDGEVGGAPLILFGHGAGAGIDHPLIVAIADTLVAEGLAVLRYQFPFMERQGGRGFGRDAPALATATVAAAAAFATTRAAGRPLFAGGHSYGGRMTTLAAAEGRLGGVAGLVLMSFPLHAAGRQPPTVAACERAAHLPEIDVPMLFLSGERDAMARSPRLEEVVHGCRAATLTRIEGADHGWKTARRRWPDGPFGAVAAEV